MLPNKITLGNLKQVKIFLISSLRCPKSQVSTLNPHLQSLIRRNLIPLAVIPALTQMGVRKIALMIPLMNLPPRERKNQFQNLSLPRPRLKRKRRRQLRKRRGMRVLGPRRKKQPSFTMNIAKKRSGTTKTWFTIRYRRSTHRL